eukprot:scaffold25490_cov68-Cyclotella_meneghiniana.AAC.1
MSPLLGFDYRFLPSPSGEEQYFSPDCNDISFSMASRPIKIAPLARRHLYPIPGKGHACDHCFTAVSPRCVYLNLI